MSSQPPRSITDHVSASTMPNRHALRSTVPWLLLSIALASGCANAPPTAIPPGTVEPLAGDEGFVVVHVDSDLGIERIEAGGRVIASQLQAGRHLWLVRMKAGRQQWTAVKLMPQAGNESAIRPEAVGVLNDREFDFEVQAGAVNYPGELVIRMVMPQFGIGSGVTVRNRNHSAMAIRRLSKSHPALLAAHPIRYAGSSGDEFLQFYTKERDRLRAPGASERPPASVPR